jgi:hypothetical protein
MSKLMKRSLRIGLIAAGAGLGLVAGGMLGNHRNLVAAGPPSSRPSELDDAIDEMDDGFKMFGMVFNLSDDQKTKLKAIEKTAADEMRADPKKVRNEAFDDSVSAKVREVLTAEQQKQFDKMQAEAKLSMKLSMTGSNLHDIGMKLIKWEGAHDGKLPPDLGSLVDDKSGARTFLAQNSSAKPPADWDKMDAKAKSDWVNKNTDFAYEGAGKKDAETGSSFVVAYIKSTAAPEAGNAFLMGDGAVHQRPADVAKAMIDELKAGKNPPPSYKEEAFMPPPPPHP